MASERTVPAIVRDIVEHEPDRELITFRDLSDSPTDERMTYGELWQRAAVFAEALDHVPRGGRVLIVLPIGNALLAAHLGVMLRGALPIIHSHPSQKVDHAVYIKHLAHVLELMSPEGIVTNRDFEAEIRTAGANGGTLITAEDTAARTTHNPREWMDVRADEVAIIQHSSGSTGLQKGVALTHEMIWRQCESYGRNIRVSPETDRVCSWIPLYHDMGLFTTWFLPLLTRVPVAAIDPFRWVQSPGSFFRLIADFHGTLCWQPNFAYNLLATRLRDEEMTGIDLGTMRGFTNCSEPARASSHEMFYERFALYGVRREALWVCYAMAENAFAVTACGSTTNPVLVRPADPAALSQGLFQAAVDGRATAVVSVGTPVDECEVKVVDEQRQTVADARVGEVALRSPFMLRQYYRNAEATEKAIDGEGWYYTGDLGFQYEGHLHITGRKKDLLIVGGRNFYPQDIEAICDRCTGAVPGRSVAIGVEDERTGTERIVVLIESQASVPEVQEELEAKARQKIFEELDCPVSEVHVVPHMWLLKTTSGKIARRPNLDRYQDELAAKRQQTPLRETVPVAGVVGMLAWTFLVALAIYVTIAVQPNASWGIYAGF